MSAAGTAAAASAKRIGGGSSLLLVVPFLCLMALAFLYPLIDLLRISFTEPELTWNNYTRLLEEPIYGRVFLRTVWIALLTAILALLLGFPVAYFMLLDGIGQGVVYDFYVWPLGVLGLFLRVVVEKSPKSNLGIPLGRVLHILRQLSTEIARSHDDYVNHLRSSLPIKSGILS